MGDDVDFSTKGYVRGFHGAVAADEPNAVLIGRDVLTAGGTAVDAAVALYFALAVTLPSVASLGGGGICLVHDVQSGNVEVLDFLALDSGGGLADQERRSAIPANIRGMAALHARYGTFDWRELLVPAENLARQGHSLSRAFTRDLKLGAGLIMQDEEARRVFGGSLDKPLKEGTFVKQLDLAAILTRVRVRGPGEFYTGPLARRIVDSVASVGGSLTTDELRSFIPKWKKPITIHFGHDIVSLAPPTSALDFFAGRMWQMLVDGDKYDTTEIDERPHLLVEVANRALVEKSRWLESNSKSALSTNLLVSPSRSKKLLSNYSATRATSGSLYGSLRPTYRANRSGTGFVIADAFGQAVACSHTMYEPFGYGRLAPGTGIVLSAARRRHGQGVVSLSPLMITNQNVSAFKLAIVGSGDSAAPSAMIYAAMRTLIDDFPLGKAFNFPRFHASGISNIVFVEPEASEQMLMNLISRGHTVRKRKSLTLLNAIYCPTGLSGADVALYCAVVRDMRGAGLVAYVDE